MNMTTIIRTCNIDYIYMFLTLCYKSGSNSNIRHLIMCFMIGKVWTMPFGLVGRKECSASGHAWKENHSTHCFQNRNFCLVYLPDFAIREIIGSPCCFNFVHSCTMQVSVSCLFPLVVDLLSFTVLLRDQKCKDIPRDSRTAGHHCTWTEENGGGNQLANSPANARQVPSMM